jgi:hypothetical protein
MSAPHTEPHLPEDILDRYAMGTLRMDSIPAVEEHLLCCSSCQLKLTEADEFVRLFRDAAKKVLESPQTTERSWTSVFAFSPVLWVGAMAVTALAVAPFLMHKSLKQAPQVAPAVVMMHSLRGQESGATVKAMKPLLLVFDLPASVKPADCTLGIVDLDGRKVVEEVTTLRNGRIEALAGNLKPGDYWVRLYRRGDGRLLAEYSLSAKDD